MDQSTGPSPSTTEPLQELNELLLTFLDDGSALQSNADSREQDVEDEEEDTSEDSRPAFLLSLAQPDRRAGSDSAKTVVARPVKRRNTPRAESGQRVTRFAHPQLGRVVKGGSLLETPPPEQPVDVEPERPQSTAEAELLYEPGDNSAAILLPSSEFGRPPFELLDLDQRRGTAASRWLWPLLIALMVLAGSVGAYLLRTTAG